MKKDTVDDTFLETSYNEKIKIEYEELKLRLEQLKKKRSWKSLCKFGAMVALPVFLMAFMLIADEWYYYDFKDLIPKILISITIGIVFAILSMSFLSIFYEMEENRMSRLLLRYETDSIQSEVKEDIFENSIKMSYKYLDQYYDQTREQAQRGFKVTVYVASFGALLIGLGITAMFFGMADPATITCASGVVTEFIAAIFFYLYNKTITSMSNYHNKLVLSHNISIALKVSDTLPTEDKVKAKNKIISELLKDVNSYLIKNDEKESDIEN